MSIEVKVYLITPNESEEYPSCLVYAESEEDARTSCTQPATRKGEEGEIIQINGNNPYTNYRLSNCQEYNETINEEDLWNGGESINFAYNGEVYALAKGIPEYLNNKKD